MTQQIPEALLDFIDEVAQDPKNWLEDREGQIAQLKAQLAPKPKEWIDMEEQRPNLNRTVQYAAIEGDKILATWFRSPWVGQDHYDLGLGVGRRIYPTHFCYPDNDE